METSRQPVCLHEPYPSSEFSNRAIEMWNGAKFGFNSELPYCQCCLCLVHHPSGSEISKMPLPRQQVPWLIAKYIIVKGCTNDISENVWFRFIVARVSLLTPFLRPSLPFSVPPFLSLSFSFLSPFFPPFLLPSPHRAIHCPQHSVHQLLPGGKS